MASTGLYTSLGYDNTDSLTNALTPQAVVVATVPSPSSSPLPATSIVTGSLSFPLIDLTKASETVTAAVINEAPFMVNLFAKMRASIATAANLDATGASSVTITSMTSVMDGVTTPPSPLAFTSSDNVNKGSHTGRLLQQLPRRLQAGSTTFTYTLVANSNTAAALKSTLASSSTAEVALIGVRQAYANALETQKDSNLFSKVAPPEKVGVPDFQIIAPAPEVVSTSTGGSSSGGGSTGGGNPVPPPSWPSAAPQPGTPGASAPLAITVQLDNIPAAFVAFGALTSYGLSALTDAIASSVSAACPACTTRITQVRDTTSGAVLFRAVRRLQGTSSLLVDYTVTVPTGASASSIACSASSTGAISSALANKGMAGVKASQVSGCGSAFNGIGGPLTGGEIAAIVICVLAAVGGVYVLANRERLFGKSGGKGAKQGGDVTLPVGGFSTGIYTEPTLGGAAASSSRPPRLQLRGPVQAQPPAAATPRAAVGGAGRSPVPSPTALIATPPGAVGGAGRSPVPSPTALSATAPAPAARAPPSPPSQSATSAATMDSRAVLRLLSPSIFRMCVEAACAPPSRFSFSLSLSFSFSLAHSHTHKNARLFVPTPSCLSSGRLIKKGAVSASGQVLAAVSLTEEEEDAVLRDGGVERLLQLARVGITR
jgi:hypothetical protein